MSPPPTRTAPVLAELEALLGDALAQENAPRTPGGRERLRHQIDRVIALAGDVLATAQRGGGAAETIAAARATLLEAHAARARDARRGAGQLSLGSQRAPTREACDDGWERVGSIVAIAEASAHEAAGLAGALDGPEAWRLARAAETAARDARRLLDGRNQAYTFHADPGFSFGEGWYLAAAVVLAGVAIQLELDKPQSAQAARFLADAGLGARLQAYRPRPRANKQLPAIVAQAFRGDPSGAQRRLRDAFLGARPIPEAIVTWTRRRLAEAPGEQAVLLWVRQGTHQPARNTRARELAEITQRVLAAGLRPILVGDAIKDGQPPAGADDLTLFWKDTIFQALDMRRAQLQLFEHLKEAYGLVGQLGVTTAGMDGPALMGLATMYLTDAPNPRMGTWVGAVPGYREVVRRAGYLEEVDDGLRRWSVTPRSQDA